jgi:hypothetical protein
LRLRGTGKGRRNRDPCMVTGVRVTRKKRKSELKVSKLKECGEVGIVLENMQQRANERE